MKKAIITLMCVLLVLSYPICANAYVSGASEWAVRAIRKAHIADIVPIRLLENYNKNITRSEFCDLINETAYMLEKKTPESIDVLPFVDVTDLKIVTDIKSAYERGIINGVSETLFAPEEEITREQIAVMFARLLNWIEFTGESEISYVFEDSDCISEWAKESIDLLCSIGVMEGVSETVFSPQEFVTREQAISMIWNLYEVITGRDYMLYEDSDSDILVDLKIIDEDAYNKGEYITTIEVLETLYKIRGDNEEFASISDWYIGDTLAEKDYLDDETKLMLLRLHYDGRNPILRYEEIATLNLDSVISEYELLLYITRFVGNTEACMDFALVYEYPGKDLVYEAAYYDNFIESMSSENADKPIKRTEFYDILHKAMFAEYYSGGYSGAYVQRWIDMYTSGEESEETKEQDKENIVDIMVEIPIKVDFQDDFTISWTLPDGYEFLEKDYNIRKQMVKKDGSTEGIYIPSYKNTIDKDDWLVFFCSEFDEDVESIRIIYDKRYSKESDDKCYYFDIEIPAIKLITEGEEITPGIFTRYENMVTVKNISLGEGEVFEKGCYYLITGYEKKYRRDEYNSVSRAIFCATDTVNQLKPKLSLSCFDEIHIQKVDLTGDTESGFVISVTPESTKIFKNREELSWN